MPIDSLNQLLALEKIHQLKYAYVRCLDQKRWADMGELFTEDATAAYSAGKYSYTGRDAIIEFLSTNMSRDGFHSSHRMHHPEVEFVSETEATGVWAMEDHNVDTDFDFVLMGAGFYEDRYVQVAGKWLIAHTGYRRTFETIGPLSKGGIAVTASWWSTDGQSTLEVQ